ncbi:MAG: metallophosphoesterase family protein [Candidatus Moraniibacteriota bacterium]|jgi:calcineurin-like phosphoesterase family protein
MNILLTSDWHKTPFAAQKFYSQKKSLGERIIQIFGGIGKDDVMQKMKHVIKSRGIQYVIHNGDLQENTFNERGILTDEDLQSAQDIIRQFKAENNIFSISLNMGNHESGYHKKTLPLATDSEGGASLASIKRFLTLAGRKNLYYSTVVLGYRLCFIPYLLTEKCGKDFNIDDMKKDILDRLEKDMTKDEKVILFVHDPDSMSNERFLKIINDHKDNIELFFCGHYHSNISLLFNQVAIRAFTSKWLLPIRVLLRLVLNIAFDKEISRGVEKYYLERIEIPKLMSEFGVKIIPAPDGMFGFGGGFMILNLDNLEVEHIS